MNLCVLPYLKTGLWWTTNTDFFSERLSFVPICGGICCRFAKNRRIEIFPLTTSWVHCFVYEDWLMNAEMTMTNSECNGDKSKHCLLALSPYSLWQVRYHHVWIKSSEAVDISLWYFFCNVFTNEKTSWPLQGMVCSLGATMGSLVIHHNLLPFNKLLSSFFSEKR